MASVIWIGYTTLYREGGEMFRRAAHALAAKKRRAHPQATVVCVAIETKRAFCDALLALAPASLHELHFIGHSGMYGIMFGTVAMPEQLSPYEWQQLRVPFAPNGEAFFHCCRSGRWFAPFFAATFGVPASGYFAYTTLSTSPRRYVPVGPTDEPVVIGIIGNKSHGLVGSALKHSRLAAAEPMRRFLPNEMRADRSYDGVAELYDAAYPDITVRAPEMAWLDAHWPTSAIANKPRVLDIGCGNGALLRHLAPRLQQGIGIDASRGMLQMAKQRNADLPHLTFHQVTTPTLPVPDASIDIVISLLSFRYLDWDPIMQEIRRVLVPGGRLYIIDMVAAPVGFRDAPQFVTSKARMMRGRVRRRAFAANLDRLVNDPGWQQMLRYNPIRAQHEYVWYLESRFPGRRVETIDVGFHARTLAFDSGPLTPGTVAPLSYP